MLITILIILIVTLITCLAEKDKVTRYTYIGFNVAFFCYSCIGIYTYKLEEIYYFSYIVSMITMNVFFLIGNNIYKGLFEGRYVFSRSRSPYEQRLTKIESINQILSKKWSIIRILSITYIAIRISELFYPEFCLKYLFTGPSFLYSNLLETTSANYHTVFGHMISTIKTLLLPFAYMYLSTKKNKFVVGYFAFDLLAIYLTSHASIGRLQVIQILVVMSLFLYSKSNSTSERARYRVLLIGVSVLSFMIYVFLQNLRSGNIISFTSINPIQAIESFAKSEFFYPRNYPMAQQLHENGVYSPRTFWLWLITLPIPKAVLTIPGVDETTSAIYRVFSYYYFGGHWYYEPGIGGMLISVLGDGIMVYGKYLSFIIVIPYAFFLSFYLSFLRKLKYSELLYFTTFFQFVVSFRPGVQYALTKINSFVAIILVVFIIKHIKTNSEKKWRSSFMQIIDKIKNNIFWSSVMQLSFGQVVGQVINIICVPILSRVYTTDDYGQLGILVSTATIITGFICLGINSAMMLAKTDEDARKAFHVSHNIQLVLATIAVIALLIVSRFHRVINTDIPIEYALILIFIYITSNVRNTLLAIYLNRLGLNKILLLSPIINSCANLIIALPLGLMSFKFYGLIASAIIAFIASNIVMSHYAKIGFKHCKLSDYKYVIKQYSDLIKYQYPSNLVTSLSTQTPNQILSSQFGNESLGSYSMCDKIFHIPFTMIATPIQTIYFRTASKMSDRMDVLSDFTFSMVSKILYVATIPVLITIFFGKDIFSFILGSEWSQAGEWASFLILMYIFAFVNNCITYCRVSIGKAKINLYTSIGNLIFIVISIVIGAFLIKSLQTTIITFSIASTVFGAFNIYITFRCMGKNYNKFLLLSVLYIALGSAAIFVKWVLL